MLSIDIKKIVFCGSSPVWNQAQISLSIFFIFILKNICKYAYNENNSQNHNFHKNFMLEILNIPYFYLLFFQNCDKLNLIILRILNF